MTTAEFLETEEAAINAADLLSLYLDDPKENPLTPIEIETFRQIVKEASKSFKFFTMYVLGLDRYPETVEKWCDKQENDFFAKYNFIRLKPRGIGKTTIYGIAFVLWVWARVSKQIRIFYSSENELLLEEVSDSVRKYLDSKYASLYSLVFGIILDKDAKNTNEIINIVDRGYGKGFSLVLRTAGRSTAGIHPHIIIIDDPCDKPDRTSEAVRRDKKIWANTLRPLLHSIEVDGFMVKHFILIATLWHFDDVTHYFMKQNEKLPDKEKFDIDIESLEDFETGESNFPEHYNKDGITVLKGQMEPAFYECQMNNRVIADGSQIFDIKAMHFKKLSDVDITQGSNYCFIDPAKGKSSKSDFPAVIFVNKQGNKLFVFDAITEKKPFSEVLDDLIYKAIQYNIIKINFEDNGTNLIEEGLTTRIKNYNSFVETYNKEATEYNRLHAPEQHKKLKAQYYAEVKGKSEGRNKHDRICNMQPVLVGGDVIFREDWQTAYAELINQIIFYPAMSHDDFPDVVEKAIRDLVKNDFNFGIFKAT